MANPNTRSPSNPSKPTPKFIEKTGEEAAVLLKNQDSALPLKAADLDSVVLIGPTAAQIDSIGINGERSVGLPAGRSDPSKPSRKSPAIRISNSPSTMT